MDTEYRKLTSMEEAREDRRGREKSNNKDLGAVLAPGSVSDEFGASKTGQKVSRARFPVRGAQIQAAGGVDELSHKISPAASRTF